MTKPIEVRVEQSFSVPPERVFDAWLDEALIARWMFAPDLLDQEVVRIRIEPRVGGTFSFVVRRPPGKGQEIDHTGTYLELARPRRLAFTWGIAGGDASRVTVDIGAGSLTLVHQIHPDWAPYAERTRQSWAKMLAKLVQVLGGSSLSSSTTAS
jgi:uncharacterized protein YndB with AHSA1/START domain